MNGKFFDLKKEKQDSMINAALKVFALNGYRHASTDDIVREAGISKGLLFHYFTNKLGVYRFIYDYSVRYMSLELSMHVKPGEKDFFEVFRQIQTAKMNAMKEYPYMEQFLMRSAYEDMSEALQVIGEKRDIYTDAFSKVYEQIDFRTVPPVVEGRKLYRFLDHAVKGLVLEHFRENSFQPDMVAEEIMDYIALTEKMVKG